MNAVVSILTRRDVRVQRAKLGLSGHDIGGFNPHPARCPGATTSKYSSRRQQVVSILTRRDVRVQPADVRPHVPHLTVSILTRRDVRVQRVHASGARVDHSSFNPHPARCPGATGASTLAP